MPADPDSWTYHRSRVASLTARGADRAEIDAARRDMRAARLRDYITRVVDEAPPLTAEQRAQLATILLAAGGGHDAA